MAATPSSLLTLSTREQNIITKAEAAIDADLRKKFERGKPVLIRHALIDYVFDENPRVLEALLDLYSGAGWDIVDYEKNGRKWFSFSEG